MCLDATDGIACGTSFKKLPAIPGMRSGVIMLYVHRDCDRDSQIEHHSEQAVNVKALAGQSWLKMSCILFFVFVFDVVMD